jgi:hypothetical protein
VVQITGTAAGSSGVLIFFETSGDDTADQQVFLEGITINDIEAGFII